MRIGLLTDTFLPVVDGVGRVVVAYANTLPTLGHQVTVCAPMYDTGHRGGHPFELIEYTGFKVPTTPQYRTGAPSMDAHYIKRIEMVPLDIVHAHSPFASGREALRLARQRCIPLVSTFHSKYYDDFLKVTRSETIARKIVSGIVKFYDKCDEIWAVSGTSAEVLREYGYAGAIQIMTNGTQQRQTSSEAIAEVSQRFALGHLPVLLFVGQIDWKKNILRILEAAALLKQQRPDFKLVLAGQGSDAEAIHKKALSLGLEEQLVMTGMIRDTNTLDALYARATLFVFPSLYDTFSLVIREAAAMDTPSVAVKGSSAAECITHLDNGLLCEDEAHSLHQALVTALSDLHATKQMGLRAHQSIPVPWEEVIKTAAGRYEQLIAQYVCKPSARHRRYQKRKTQTKQ